MANPFPRTTRSLRGERDVFQLVFLGACVLALGAWAVWFLGARLPVFIASDTARLETGRAAVPIAPQVGGRLRRIAVTVGQRVAAGDLLAELDTEMVSRRLDETRAQRDSKIQGVTAAQSGLDLARREAAEKSRSAVAAAALAEEELRRKESLHHQGVLSDADLSTARTAVEQRRAEAAGLALSKELLVQERRKLQPEEIRDQGVGLLLGRVLESEAVETLTLNGGFLTVVGLIEIAVSALLLTAGAGGVRHAGLLGLWLLAILGLSRHYYRERRVWTEQRLEMTHALVERLVGHRTRLAQEDRDHWHDEEDHLLATYLADSRRFDRTKALLLSAVPRGWLVVGLCGLLPGFLSGSASTALLAVAVGGMITAFRGFGKAAEGFSKLSIAMVAWQQADVLFRAAARPEETGAIALPAAEIGAVLEGVDLTFRHRDRGRPVLDGASLAVVPGERILLEGASGSGKSTLAALLAGLREPAAGLVLLDGFDRHSLGAEAWRRRVALAPQFHENHVFTETFAFNLLMGRRWPPTADDLADATALCHEIGLGGLLERMPSGLQQVVGESGWQLSHGERSRLYMARALLQEAGTVLLDESFAALDPENLDQALDCALRRAPALVVIAHP